MHALTRGSREVKGGSGSSTVLLIVFNFVRGKVGTSLWIMVS